MTSFVAAGDSAHADAAVLSISEVSRRTGIPVAGLRNWEQRYGLPRPQRSPSGQRRYTEADCDLLTEVLRRRAAGLSLSAAMAQATASTGDSAGESLGEGLRSRSSPGSAATIPPCGCTSWTSRSCWP